MNTTDIIHLRISDDERQVIEKIKLENTRPGLKCSDADALHIALAIWGVVSLAKHIESEEPVVYAEKPE